MYNITWLSGDIEMNKIIVIIFVLCLCFSLFADDAEDMEYIKKLYGNKYYNEAVSELHIFMKKYTDSPHYYAALNLLANSYYALEKYNNAKTVFKTLRMTEFKNNAYYFLALIAVKENSLEEVDADLAKIDKKSKLRSEGTYLIANHLYKRNDFENAEKYFKKVLQYKDRYSTESLKKLGFIYYKQKEFLKTSTVLTEYIKKTEAGDDLALVYYILAYSSEKNEDPDHALKYYQEIEKNYKDSEYYFKSIFNSAKLYKQAGDAERIRTTVAKLKGSEYEKDGLIVLSEFEYENKNYSEAERIYEKILQKEDDQKIIYKLVLVLIKQEKYEKALPELEKVKNTDYRSEYYYYTGFILHKQKEYKQVLDKLNNIEKENIKDDYKEDCYFFLAESAYNIEKYDVAERYYNELYLLTDSKKYIYHVFLSVYKAKDIVKSEILFQTYKKKFPEDKEYKKDIYSSLGELYAENEKYAEAEDVYKEYLKIEKDSITMNNLIAVLLKQNKHEEMLKYLNAEEDTIENMYSKGLAYTGMHDYENASRIYKQIINQKENDYTEKSFRKLIEALFSLQKYKEVVKYSSEYLKKDYKENKIEILDKKGLAYFRMKKYTEAITVYEELKNFPGVKDYAYFMLGEIYYNRKDHAKAKESYGYVNKNMPDSKYHRISLYWLINITFQNEEYKECEKYINSFLEKYQEGEYVEEIISYLGDIYIAGNQVEKAAEAYEKLYNLSKDEATKENLCKSLIKMYSGRKDYNNAVKWLKRLKDSSFKHLWLGIIYEKQGKQKSAVASYKKILNDEENGDKANYYLGSYYLRKKKYASARKYLEKIADFEMSEYKDDALLKIGLSHEAENSHKRAISYFMKIKLLYENSPYQDIVTLKIAENYEKMEDMDKSIEHYKEFFSKFENSKYYGKVTERLLVYYLNKDNKEEAKKYFNVLKKINPEKIKKYEQYFQE